ncbi:MAG: TonB-dependent receptor [Gammaproteobacteria bacterium]|nr:TonB-dependent receptor [Gammaproteobacteria bacterium]
MSSTQDTDRYGPLPRGAAQLALVGGAIAGLQQGTAIAQDGASEPKQEIIVTGSRISRLDAETADPVQVISKEAIQESGVSTMGELLQKLPAIAGAAINPAVNNGGGEGASNIELRGLGAERTLVLLNGRRYGSLGRLTSAIDANSIPVTMIERVEVLKQGAGAIYGSDAIGGVVNFITKSATDGVELGVDYGESSEGDGARKGGNVTWGSKSETGSVMLGFSYTKQDDISAADRAFSKDAIYFYGSIAPAGSSRTPRGRYFLDTASATGLAGIFDECDPGPAGGITRIPGATGESLADFRCYDGAIDSYNFQPENLILTPSERSSVFAMGSHQINDDLELYGEFLYNRTTSGFKIAPLPFDARSDNVVISGDNIYNPFGIDFGGTATDDDGNILNPNATFRLEALGNRANAVETWQGQITGGLRGALFDTGWSWDASYAYSRMDQDRDNFGYPFKTAFAASLGPSFIDGGGTPRCGTPSAPIAGCVPFNIFNPTDESQLAAINAIVGTYTDKYEYEMQSAVLALDGDVMDLPAGTMKAAVGFEYRDQSGKFDTDYLTQAAPPLYNECLLSSDTCSGDSYGQFDVKEYYGELFIPILADAPFARSLNATVGVRYSDYSTFGDTTNASLKVEWRPVDSLLVRASYADIFRAPTILDISQAPSASAETFTDPCVGLTAQQVVDNPNYALACEGVPTDGSFAQPNSQIDAIQLGAAFAGFDLKPEEGDAFTAGVVFEPEAIPGLYLSADFWQYEIDDTIQQIDVNVAAETCVDTGAALYCDLINRFSDGTINRFLTPTVNLGNLKTNGVDFSAAYALPTTAIGDFRLRADATYTNKYDSQVVDGGPVTEVAGYYDRQYGNLAKWRAQGSLAWEFADFNAQVVARWIDSVNLSDPDGAPDVQPDLEIASQIYWDLTAGYTLEKTNTKFQVGVNNIFDNQPPFLYQNNVTNANTDVETYDTIGRFFFGSIVQKF